MAVQNIKGSGQLIFDEDPKAGAFKYSPETKKTRHARFTLIRIPASLCEHKLLIRGAFRTTQPVIVPIIISLFFSLRNDSIEDSLHRATLHVNSEDAFICVSFDQSVSSDIYVHLYISKDIEVCIEAYNLHLISCRPKPSYATLTAQGELSEFADLDLSKRWEQQGNILSVTWLGRTFYTSMPAGWNLSELSDRHIEAVNDFLFGPIELVLFGRSRFRLTPLPPLPTEEKTYRFDTLLSFSTGEDSTAALIVLPSDRTATFYLRRSYTSFRFHNGKIINLSDRKAERDALARVPDCIIVCSDFELVGLSVGFPHGLRDSFGYVLFGILLADFIGARSVSTGSQLDTMMMANGREFVDPFARNGAQNFYLRNIFSYVGLDLICPVAAISEVLTNKLCRLHADRYISLSCPNSDEAHQPCRVCYKCFRKIRISGDQEAFAPSSSTSEFFKKRPLKMAAPTMYAVQKSGFQHPTLDCYKADFGFLERYYSYALENFVPEYLLNDVCTAYEQNGIEPMTETDEIQLRCVGQVFNPSNYNEQQCFPSKLFDGRKRRRPL